MNIKTQLLVGVVALIGMYLLVRMIRKGTLKLKYALSWFVLDIGILLFGCFPSLTSRLAALFGIETPVNMLFFIGFCFSLLVILSLTVTVSRLTVSVKRLTQEIGMLKKELKEVRDEQKEE